MNNPLRQRGNLTIFKLQILIYPVFFFSRLLQNEVPVKIENKTPEGNELKIDEISALCVKFSDPILSSDIDAGVQKQKSEKFRKKKLGVSLSEINQFWTQSERQLLEEFSFG